MHLLSQGQEREEEGGSEDIVTEVDNVLGKLMASLQKGNTSHIYKTRTDIQYVDNVMASMGKGNILC